jgi:hypothetical protein
MITQEYLKSILSYNPETGIFCNIKTNKIYTKNTRQGYVQIAIKRKIHYAHRLAWLYINGCLPSKNIDHINGIRDDNRISNIRDISQAGNMQNQIKARIDNKSTGLLGAYSYRDQFTSAIQINGKQIHLGHFKTAEEAHNAYLIEKRKIHQFGTL